MLTQQAVALLGSAVTGVLLCIFGSEVPELAVALLGISMYFIYQPRRVKKVRKAAADAKVLPERECSPKSDWRRANARPSAPHASRVEYRRERVARAASAAANRDGWEAEFPMLFAPERRYASARPRTPLAPRQEYRFESVAPVADAVCRSVGWEAEAAEFVAPQRRLASARPRAPHAPKQEYRQAHIVPVASVAFRSVGWEEEVPELLQQIRPNEESDRMVQQLVQTVQRAIHTLFPEAEIVGCASGNIRGKRAFGVAIPEVDVVMTVNPTLLVDRLSRLRKGTYPANLDAKKLQKAAIRACTDQLVSVGGFKFRRSALRGDEPKFTMVAPVSAAAGDCVIAIDFSVNAATPLQAAALFRSVTMLDPRASDVILLTRRWARDRGIAHAAQGHLPPYGWTLLATYFLQTGAVEEGSGILPAAPGVSGKTKAPRSDAVVAPELSAAELFKRCLLFYAKFRWREECVSVRTGRRAPPGLALPLHVTFSRDGKARQVAPSIEDPFNEGRNIAASMSAEGVVRLGEEFDRASGLIAMDASLAQLLELWTPAVEGAAHAAEVGSQ